MLGRCNVRMFKCCYRLSTKYKIGTISSYRKCSKKNKGVYLPPKELDPGTINTSHVHDAYNRIEDDTCNGTFKNAIESIISNQFNQTTTFNFGVAVSGGRDSMALAILANKWFEQRILSNPDDTLSMVIVDHGLRPESEKESNVVYKWLTETLKVNTTILKVDWSTSDAHSEINHSQETLVVPKKQLSSRNKRYDVISNWSRDNNITFVMTAHHEQDQLETFIHRFAFASGLKGLCGIPEVTRWHNNENGLVVVRPLLKFKRETLTNILIQQNMPWVDDPTNFKQEEFRTKIRSNMNAWNQAGVRDSDLLKVQNVLRKVNELSEMIRLNWIEKNVNFSYLFGSLSFDTKQFDNLPSTFKDKLLVTLIRWVSRKEDLRLRDGKSMAVYKIVDRHRRTRRNIGGCFLSVTTNKCSIMPDNMGVEPVTFKYSESVLFDKRFVIKVTSTNKKSESELIVRFPTASDWALLKEKYLDRNQLQQLERVDAFAMCLTPMVFDHKNKPLIAFLTSWSRDQDLVHEISYNDCDPDRYI
ncbi:tilS [Acrasis kona]|uniref:tRNA(Ile)-lysidine synthetase n=1 Tax=Acrasis kona TaxID=1008807 RepID=A0AAW2YJU6_9EUKA